MLIGLAFLTSFIPSLPHSDCPFVVVQSVIITESNQFEYFRLQTKQNPQTYEKEKDID